MHANFGLGMEALAEGRIAEAEDFFNQVQAGRKHLMYVDMMSRALLEHQFAWESWVQSRSELLDLP